MGAIGDAVSGALNTVEHLGSAVGDLASGNISGALGDIGQAATSGIGAAVNGFMATNPEMGAISKLGGGLSSLLGAAGGASGLGGAGGSPSPFGLGNLLPGALQSPLGNLYSAAAVWAEFLAEAVARGAEAPISVADWRGPLFQRGAGGGSGAHRQRRRSTQSAEEHRRWR